MNKNVTEYDMLISKYLDNDITSDEQSLLEEWIKDSKENEKHFRKTAKVWESSIIFSQDKRMVRDKFLRLFEQDKRKRERITLRRTLGSVAAIVLLLVVVRIFAPQILLGEKMLVVATQNSKKEILLPDGSSVWLNANSTLRYPSKFKNARKAELSGEAIFDIKPDHRNPFFVHTDKMTIKVTGTRFLVTDRTEAAQAKAVLETGTINLTVNGLNETFAMVPNQQVVYNELDGTASMQIVRAADFTSWNKSSLIFENDRLHDVFIQLGKWYDVDIHCGNKQLLDTPVSFTLDEETLPEILEILQQVTSLSWKENEDKKIIMIE